MTKDKIISGLKMTMELFLFDPSTGETCEPDDLNELNRTTYDACKGAVELLENLEPHWIPVTERLPEDDVFVLLTVRRMDDSYNHVPFISTGYISWNHQCWWCAHDGNCKDANVEVLAWMPLPKPFKEVTDGRN